MVDPYTMLFLHGKNVSLSINWKVLNFVLSYNITQESLGTGQFLL